MPSYDSRHASNPNFVNDRRVINNSSSIRVTVGYGENSNRNNLPSEIDSYQHLSDTRMFIAGLLGTDLNCIVRFSTIPICTIPTE